MRGPLVVLSWKTTCFLLALPLPKSASSLLQVTAAENGTVAHDLRRRPSYIQSPERYHPSLRLHARRPAYGNERIEASGLWEVEHFLVEKLRVDRGCCYAWESPLAGYTHLVLLSARFVPGLSISSSLCVKILDITRRGEGKIGKGNSWIGQTRKIHTFGGCLTPNSSASCLFVAIASTLPSCLSPRNLVYTRASSSIGWLFLSLIWSGIALIGKLELFKIDCARYFEMGVVA